MEATISTIVALMLEKGGLWAALVIILGLAIWRLFDLLMKSQEKRIEEKGETIKAMSDTAKALESLTKVVEAGRRRT